MYKELSKKEIIMYCIYVIIFSVIENYLGINYVIVIGLSATLTKLKW